MGLIFDPAKVSAIFQGLYAAFLAPAWAFISGAASFLINLVEVPIKYITQGASNAGSFIWNNTGGRVASGLHSIGL